MVMFTASPLKRDVRSPMSIGFRRSTLFKGARVVTLAGLDTISFILAWQLSEVLGTPTAFFGSLQNPISLLPLLAAVLAVLMAGGFYRSSRARRSYFRLVKSITLADLLLVFIAYSYQPSHILSRSHFLWFWLFSVVFITTGRLVVDYIVRALRRKGAIRYPVVLIASSENLQESLSLIHQENRYNIVEVSDASALSPNERDKTFAKLCQLDIAEAFVSWDVIKDQMFLCWQFQAAGVLLHIIPNGLEPLFQRSRFWVIRDFPALSFAPSSMTSTDFWLKRIFDFCVALVLLAVFSPIYLAIALLIKFDSPGPVFYPQTRIGLHGNPFKALKFRTMVTNADKLQKELEARNESKDGVLFKIKDDPRVTRIGKFLRQYSLDELPQLLNVLLGDMSLVGPRPLPVRDIERCDDRHLVRHEVLPGITGLWQVSGRSDITNFEDVIKLDLAYIQNWSLGLDFAILLKTVKVVLQKTGAY